MRHWTELSFLISEMNLMSNLKAQLSSEFLSLRGMGVWLTIVQRLTEDGGCCHFLISNKRTLRNPDN